MTGSTDWWLRKMGGTPSVPSAAPVSLPPAFPHHLGVPQPAPRYQSQPQPARKFANLSEALAAGMTGTGGDAKKAGENSSCPNCGSANYFSNRTNIDAKVNKPVAPRCFDCGFNEIFGIQMGAL